MTDNNFLAHFGVRGMKWGKRKASSVRSATSKTRSSADSTESKSAVSKAKKRGLSSLSNKEMQSTITRQNLEKQYSQLNPTKQAKAAKITSKLLGKVGNQVLSVVTAKVINVGVDAAFKAATKGK